MPAEKSTVKAVESLKPNKVKNIELIKKWEGLKLNAYLPTPRDKWTIGYGHTKGVFSGMMITQAQAEQFLREDLNWVENCLNTKVTVPLTQNQYDALGSLTYNIGETNFGKSTLLRKLNEKDYRGAADQFLVWNKQRNGDKFDIIEGLVNRRADERKVFLS